MLSVVGPWLHVALHDHLLAHHHDAFGHTVGARGHRNDPDRSDSADRVRAHGHRHDSAHRGDAIHEHDSVGTAFAQAVALTARDGLARLVAPGSLHDLCHEHVAVAIASPVLVGPPSIDEPTRLLATHSPRELESRELALASARGPPGDQGSHEPFTSTT